MKPFEQYLQDLRMIRSTGASVPETSYYSVLAILLNEIGKTLKPKVRCILQLANRGAGNPDGGLFTSDQFQKTSDTDPLPGQLPERGAIEIKPTRDDAWVTASGKQVSKYWERYGLVLVTNYRDFVLVGKDANGKPIKLETYRLAENESEFWSLCQHPQRAAKIHGQRFIDYLKRVMLHAAPLSSPEDVAWFLASYARDAKSRIENVELPALAAVREALEEALGLKFEGDKGEHFFRSTLVQTLFYGLFSAWVLWSKQNPPGNGSAKFDWKQAAWSLHVPMIRALFEQVAAPTKLKPLGLVEPLSWASATLNRVDRQSFFSTFDQGYAVQYFYEPFLQQFDPELRKQLGVWYTPPEIVKYMVARVDTVLREELEIEDGLADPRVYVLDPCCGTGAYLVEVLHRIGETLKAKGGDALVSQDLKKAAMERVFGFEILPAPFVVSHLQLGLLLQLLQAPLSYDSSERVAVYLTNSLTGWTPPKGPKQHLMFPEMEEERDAAEEIKRDKPILVILGNPPYNAFAGVSPAEEEGLVESYKEGLNKSVTNGGWGTKKFNLDDLYVRFFRLAERRIVEGKPGIGIVCFISNFSYLGDPSFVVMRKRFLDEFDSLWFDCMNGDSRETGKLTPDGKPDPSVFSTEYHSVGIRVGTAIGLLTRKEKRAQKPTVRYRDFWGVTKRADLLESLKRKKFNGQYETANPAQSNRYSFRPSKVAENYMTWPRITELSSVYPYNGPIERRGNSLIVHESAKAELGHIRHYLDPAKSDEEIRAIAPRFMLSSGEFDAKQTRQKLKGRVTFDGSKIVRYPFKPFDVRLAYLDPDIQPLFSRPSPELLTQGLFPGNRFLITRDTADKSPEGPPFLISKLVCDYDCISGHARHFPFRVVEPASSSKLQGELNFKNKVAATLPRANLSQNALAYFSRLGITYADTDADIAGMIWMHVLAIGYSPAYLAKNANGIRQDWPRIPLPDSKQLLQKSAKLGQEIAALLDTESHVKDVTSGAIRTELKTVGIIVKTDGVSINPDTGGLDLTAGWGHLGKGKITMPGTGKVIERQYTPDELMAMKEGATRLGLSLEQALDHLGKNTCDIYLNNTAFWKNIPVKVWEYTIGGYQVIKKWLSYRERDILGRGLTMEEAREVTNIARRISAILLLEPALDENYNAVKQSSYDWSTLGETSKGRK